MKIASLIILSLLPVAFAQDPVANSKSDDDGSRVKRAGFSLFTGALQNLQKSAFSASASLSSGSSSHSSGASGSLSSSNDQHGNSYGHGSDYEEHQHDTKSFDGWSLKKSILNTLLQAVKAIAGGVTTLSGQLIKGSGYLVSQKGKLIAKGGDAVSDAGKSVIASAHLVKPESHGHGYESQNSIGIGHILGSTFGDLSSGLTKSISGLSAGSAGSITSLSSGSAGHVTSLSGSSSSHGSAGSSGSSSSGSHGESYGSDNHGPSHYNVPETNYASYDAKPAVVLDSYGPPKVSHEYGVPKPTYAYVQDPHSGYGAPGDFDGSYKSSSNQEAADVLSSILKDLPHKPMKSLESYNSGHSHSFNQLPIPDDLQSPPPFKPLNSFPTYNIPFQQNIQSEYGPPNHYSDHFGQSSNKKFISVNPKAYDIYHSMKVRTTQDKNFVTLPPFLDDIDHEGLEIHKSIEYSFKA